MSPKPKTAPRKKNHHDTMEDFRKAFEHKGKEKYFLRLFITGMSPRSMLAIENARDLCERYLKCRYTLEIIDIYKEPVAAMENQIFAAPTLIKRLPLPIRKFVGDMTKTEKIIAGLDIKIVEESRES